MTSNVLQSTPFLNERLQSVVLTVSYVYVTGSSQRKAAFNTLTSKFRHILFLNSDVNVSKKKKKFCGSLQIFSIFSIIASELPEGTKEDPAEELCSKLFYQTPNEFFADGEIDQDAADTGNG